MMLRYEFIGGSSRKFWEIFPVNLSGYDYIVRVRYGRIGTNGQENIKVFERESAAKRYYDEKIEEKCRKGYKKKTSTPTPAPLTTGLTWPVFPLGVLAPKPKAQPACEHATLTRRDGTYVCMACKKQVEFDKAPVDTPEVQQKVRRFFDRSVSA
jgi:predicted DNA-binding WGR domain protein